MNNPEEGGDVPVLTQVVEEAKPPPSAPEVDSEALETLARQIEGAVLERLGPEIDRATDRVRNDLTASLAHTVREAVAASLAQALAVPKRD
jgi:hypothetical protein